MFFKRTLQSMVRYHIKATEYSPEVLFDFFQGVLEVNGPSCMRKSECFYGKLLVHASDLNDRLSYHKLKVRLSFSHVCETNIQSLYDFLAGISQLNSVRGILIDWEFPNTNDCLRKSGITLARLLQKTQKSSLRLVAM